MPVEIQANVIGSLIQVIGGFILGLVVAWLTLRWQRKRLVVTFVVAHLPVVRYRPGVAKALLVSVNEFAMTDDPEDINISSYIPTDNATNFEVRLTNTSTEDLENPVIEIALDQAATIVAWETDAPESAGNPVAYRRECPHALTIKPRYFKRGKGLLVWLTSIGTEATACTVTVHGRDIETVPLSSSLDTFSTKLIRLAWNLWVLVLAMIGFVIFAPPTLVATVLGTTVETREITRVVPPGWFSWVLWAFVVLLGALMAYGYVALESVIRYIRRLRELIG